MSEQRRSSVAEWERHIDGVILGLLLGNNQRPWAVEEIEREIGDDTRDSLNRLYGAGLIHRLEGFVWATRATIVADDLEA
jgi:hypothetical protein